MTDVLSGAFSIAKVFKRHRYSKQFLDWWGGWSQTECTVISLAIKTIRCEEEDLALKKINKPKSIIQLFNSHLENEMSQCN